MDTLVLMFTFFFSALVYFISQYFKNRKYYEHASKIPGPPAYPIFGHFLDFLKAKNGILTYLSECQDKYGNRLGIWLGSTLYALVANPEDAEILLKDTTNLRKSGNYEFIVPWLGRGLVTSYGNHWHSHRKILTPAFHFKITDRFLEVFNDKGKILLEKLSKHDGEEAFNVFPYINLYALEAIIESAMGIKLDVQENEDNEYVKAVHGITKIAHKRVYIPFFKSDFIFSFSKLGKEQNRLLGILHGLCDNVIQKRKQLMQNKKEEIIVDNDIGIKKRLAFLDLLLEGQKNGSGLTDQDIRDEVNTFMFAGHDTTTAGICFTLYHLSNEKEIQQKVYEEVTSILGFDEDVEITLDHLAQASYLDKVIKESMRLSPPIPIISRTLDSDVNLKDCIFPAKSSAAVFIYKLHRNPEIYPDPEKFDPERFSKDNISKRHPFSYVPFSAGPRNCIGQKYAQLELKATLMKVLRKFEILPGSKINHILSEIVLKAPSGHNIRIRKR